MEIIISGAGIAGLCVALAFKQRGGTPSRFMNAPKPIVDWVQEFGCSAARRHQKHSINSLVSVERCAVMARVTTAEVFFGIRQTTGSRRYRSQ
jgi:flavin-dependent dehydrogenase